MNDRVGLSEPVALSGAITGLEHRHSMWLKRLFQPFAQDFFDKGQGVPGVFVPADGQNPLNLGLVEFDLHFFEIHGFLFNQTLDSDDEYGMQFAVRFDCDFFKVFRGRLGRIFNDQSVGWRGAFRICLPSHLDVLAGLGTDFHDLERLHRNNFDLRGEGFTRFSAEADISIGNTREFRDISHDTQLDYGMLWIVGVDLHIVTELSAAVPGGFDLDRYFALAAGGDLPLVKSGCAASVGLDAFDRQRGVAFVLDDKIMSDVLTVDDGRELILRLGYESRWRGRRLRFRGGQTAGKDHKSQTDDERTE